MFFAALFYATVYTPIVAFRENINPTPIQHLARIKLHSGIKMWVEYGYNVHFAYLNTSSIDAIRPLNR